MLELFNIPFESLNFLTILPMLVGIFGALVILVLDLCLKATNKELYTILALLFLMTDLGIVLFSAFSLYGSYGFFDLILVDGFSILGQSIILFASIVFLPLTLGKIEFVDFKKAEYYSLFLFMTIGFQFMVSSDHLIVMFLGLETGSLALYALIAMHNRQNSLEAAIKYFTMGALAAACFVFGSMLLYATTGHLDLANIARILIQSNYEPAYLVLTSVAFLLVPIGFKISLVPFHTWTPDAYEGSNDFLAGYMSIVPKIAAFVIGIRIFDIFTDLVWVHTIFYILVVITITLPNLVALVQQDVKRMLAYSSISHAGFAFAMLLISNAQSYSALFVYWILFLATNLGAFGMLWISSSEDKKWDERYEHPYIKFSGLIKTNPISAILMGLFMLSLAGIPPFSIFWGKLYLLSTTINQGYVFLAFVMAINSAIAAYYYLKLVVYMFLKEPIDRDREAFMQNISLPIKIAIFASVCGVLGSMFVLDGLLYFLYELVSSSLKFQG